MNIYSLIPFIAIVAYIPLLAILVNSRPWSRQQRLFVWYLITAMVWSLSSFLLHSNFFIEDKLLIAKFSICAFLWMAVQLYWFSRSFGYGSPVFGVRLGYGVLVAVAILAGLGYMPQSVAVGEGVTIDFGIWVLAAFAPLAILTADNVRALVRKLSGLTDQMERTRIVYILIGVGVMTLFSVTNLADFLRRFPVDHFGNLACAGIWTYATMRYRIVDVRLIARRGLAWAGLLAIGASGYLLLFFLIHLLAGLEMRTATLALSTVVAAAMVVLVYLLRRPFIGWVDRFFYKESYDYRQKLFDFVRHKLSGVFSLKEFGEGLLPLLTGSLDCQQAYLLLPESGNGGYVAEFIEPQKRDGPPLRIREDSPILEWLKRESRFLKWLKRESRHLSKENLDILPEFHGLWSEEEDELRALGIELLFPLISRGNLVGILALGKKKSGKYLLEDINLAETIVNQVAASLEKEYLQEQLRRREQELSLINRLAGVMTSSLNIQEVYDAFVTGLREVIDVDWATITFIGGDELQFEALSTQVGSAWRIGERIPLKGTATEWVASHKKTLVEPDLAQKSRFWTGEDHIKRGIRSIVYLPLLVKGEAIGSLAIASRQPKAYSPEQVHLLERLASQIAMPAENSRLYAKAEQRARVDELTGLFNRRHFDELFGQEIDRHSRYSGMLSLVLLDLDFFKDYNDRQGHLAGDKVLAQVGWLIKRSARGTDVAFRYGGDEFAILLPQSASDDAFAVAERVRGRIAGEMEGKGIGVTVSLGLASWPSDGVTLDEMVNAADRALYYAKRTGGNRTCVVSKMLPSLAEEAVPRANVEREALSTIYALAATIEARDTYTYGHSRKVSRYAVALAEALGLPSEKVAIVSAAALLHDIGKIGIADEVLNKVDALDAREWELIKSHPKLSATIVGHVPSLTPCLPAILHHQERWDGTGYPSGLKGEAIPLEARILAVADAFDAMTSPRPYRGPLSYKEALEELRRGSGSQFDPALVEVFLPIALATAPEEIGVGENVDSSKADS